MNKKIALILAFIVLPALACLYFFCQPIKTISVEENKLYPILIKKGDFENKKYPLIFNRENSKLSLFMVGDVMLDRSVWGKTLQIGQGDYDFPFLLINSSTDRFDLRIANLEGPITDNKSIVSPERLVFTFSPNYLKPLSKNFDILNLANNHTNNFGFDGLNQTHDYLEKNNLAYFGGPSNSTTTLSLVLEKNDFKIALIGFNDLINFDFNIVLEEIEKLLSTTDYIIVFPHWGTEYKFRPNTSQIEKAHQMIDAGADLIIGGHPHVIQSVEKYQEKFIFYSLGNFIFDQHFSAETMTGITIGLKLEKIADLIVSNLEIIPIKINSNYQPYFLSDLEKEKVLDFLVENSDISLELKTKIKSGIIK